MKKQFTSNQYLRFVSVTLFILLAAGQSWAQSQWELEPKEQPFLEAGKFTAIEGKTDETGVRFILNNNKFDQPVVVTLISKDPKATLTLKMATESWDQIHREVVTDAEGHYVGSFRGQDMMAFWLTGPEGADYRMSVWVSPPQEFGRPSTLVSMDEMESGSEESPVSVDETVSTPGQAEVPQAGNEQNHHIVKDAPIPVWAFASVGISVICLMGMGAMFFQLRNSRNATNVIALGLSLSLLGTQVAHANTDTTPSTISGPALQQAFQELIPLLRALAGRSLTLNEGTSASGHASNDVILRGPDRNSTGELSGNRTRQNRLDQRNQSRRRANAFRNGRDAMRNTAAQAAGILELARAAAEFYNPSVAPLAADFLPGDLPNLPTRGYWDADREVMEQFEAAESQLLAIVQRMEQNRYHYQVLLAKVGAFNDFTNASASMNPLAAVYAMKVKNDPELKRKMAAINKQYDDAFQDLITQGNEELLKMAKIEREAFKDQDWYHRYGLPFYTYMNNRYTRRAS